jgi:hypothetical protein
MLGNNTRSKTTAAKREGKPFWDEGELAGEELPGALPRSTARGIHG